MSKVKDVFVENKKFVIAGVLVAIGIFVGVGVAFASGVISNKDAVIGAEAAVEIALKDAGVTAEVATVKRTELDYDDGIQIYDVGFYAGNTEYDYDIEATTGKILKKDYDEENQVTGNEVTDISTSEKAIDSVTGATEANDTVKDTGDATVAGNDAQYIGVDKAKSIAIAHAGLTAEQISFSKAKLENDDGKYIYEVDFYSGTLEYDYEVDAKTGTVTESSSETID